MNFSSGLRILFLLGVSLVSACNSDASRFIDAARAAELQIRSVQLTPNTLILGTGEAQQMQFEATLADGSSYDLTHQASWTSDDDGIATVDNNGLVSSQQKSGITLIHARFAGFDKQVTVQVSNAKLVSLEIDGARQIDVCKPLKLTLTGSFDDGTVRVISGRGEQWSVTPVTGTTIDSTGKLTVTDGALAQVEVGASKDNVVTAKTLAVNQSLESLILTKQPQAIEVGNSATLQATGKYRDGSTVDLTGIASWSSSNPAIATLAPGGKVTAVTVGTSTARAACGGVTGSALITVIPQSLVQAVEINSGDTRIKVTQGDKLALTLTAIDSIGKRTLVTEDAEWTETQVSGGQITVSNKSGTKGEVDTSNAGEALVTATYKGKSDLIQVIVEAKKAAP